MGWEILKLLISHHPGAPAWHYLESSITPNVLSQGDQEVAVIAGSWEMRHWWQPTVIYPKAVMTSFSPHEKHKLGLSLMEVLGFSVSQRSFSFSVSRSLMRFHVVPLAGQLRFSQERMCSSELTGEKIYYSFHTSMHSSSILQSQA